MLAVSFNQISNFELILFIYLKLPSIYQRILTNKQRMLHKNHSEFRHQSYGHKQYYILLKLR